MKRFVALLVLAFVLWAVPVAAMQMATGFYVGDGNDPRSPDITGVGFQPDLVIIKADAGARPVYRTSTMDAGDSAIFDLNAACALNRIQAFKADGFEVGDDNEVNNNGTTYHYIAFRDNGDGDFAVGSYTGDDAATKAISGLGFQPNLVWIKGDDGTLSHPIWRPSSLAGDATLWFDATDATADYIESLDADGFTVGDDDGVNEAAVVYHWVAFKSVTSEFAVGSYTGDGNDPQAITGVGFEPDYLWVKSQAGAAPRKGRHASETHAADDSMYFRATANAADGIQSLDSDGFSVGGDDEVNENTKTYHYAAWRRPGASAATGLRGAASTLMQ